MRSSHKHNSHKPRYEESRLFGRTSSFLPQPTFGSRYGHAYDCFTRAQDFVEAGNLVRALDQYNAAIDIFERLKKQLSYKHPLYQKIIRSLTGCYRGKTEYYEQQGLLRNALEQNILACQTFRQIDPKPADNDYRALARLDFNSVRLCNELDDDRGVIKHSLEGIAALKNIPKTKREDCDHSRIAHYYNSIGKLYFNKGSVKKACLYFNKADVSLMRMAHPLKKDLRLLKESFGEIASFYMSKKDVPHGKKYEAKHFKYLDLLINNIEDRMRFFSRISGEVKVPPIVDDKLHCSALVRSKSNSW